MRAMQDNRLNGEEVGLKCLTKLGDPMYFKGR